MHSSSEIKNRFFSKPFLDSLFFTQNKWHQHGVLVHTIRVVFAVLKAGDFRMLGAAFLHDIGKPSTAFKKDDEDFLFHEWSFTDHEERSYEMIKDYSFISEYTKNLVRYHYLIRDIKKSKKENLVRYAQKYTIWDALDDEMKRDLEIFLVHDDAGKGKKRR